MVVVTPGREAQAATYARSLGLDFPVLADAGREVYRLYGLDRMALGMVQRSEMFVIDKEGIIRMAQGHGLPNRLPEVSEVLEAVKTLTQGKGE